MARVLVTGASGHLGAVVVERLLAGGSEVVAVVRRDESKRLLSRLFAGRPLEIRAGDLATDAAALVSGGELDGVVHAAAFIPPGKDEAGCLHDLYEANLRGTMELLTRLEGRVRSFVLVSSLSVYAPPRGEDDPFVEGSPLLPETPYGATKLAEERVVAWWAKEQGAPLLILRSASIYGPGESQRRVLPIFFQHALAGQDIYVDGLGRSRRNFVYVGDAADAVVRGVAERRSGVCNLAGEAVFDLGTLAEAVVAACESKARVLRVPGRRQDLVLDTSHARALGIVCATPLAHGLARQAAWLRSSSDAREAVRFV